MPSNTPVNESRTPESRWKELYKIGGLAAIIAAVLLFMEIIVFTFWPQPSTVLGYFTLFQSNKLIGLLDFYLLEIPAYIFFIPIFLAVYVAIRQKNESYTSLAMILVTVGVAVFLATNNPFSLLSLSDQYMAATTEAQKSVLLAAGQAVIANTGQRAVGGFNIGFLLVSVAGLIYSAVMLRSDVFSKTVAYVGILAFTISLTDYLRIVFIPESISLLLVIAILSGLFLLIWLILVGRNLIHISNNGS